MHSKKATSRLILISLSAWHAIRQERLPGLVGDQPRIKSGDRLKKGHTMGMRPVPVEMDLSIRVQRIVEH